MIPIFASKNFVPNSMEIIAQNGKVKTSSYEQNEREYISRYVVRCPYTYDNKFSLMKNLSKVTNYADKNHS